MISTLDDLIWRYCVRKTDQWSLADYNPPIWWTYITEPVGWFVSRQLDRLMRKFNQELAEFDRE